MLTYKLTPRKFTRLGTGSFSFPSRGTVNVELSPGFLFGVGQPLGSTLFKGRAISRRIDSVTGKITVLGEEPFERLQLAMDLGSWSIRMDGNELEINGQFQSVAELSQAVLCASNFIPMLLSVYFCDPVWVSNLSGTLGQTRYELWYANYDGSFDVIDHAERLVRIRNAMTGFVERKYDVRRLLGAMEYLHVAQRLRSCAESVGEFLSEIVVNMAKTLLALFDHNSLDRVGAEGPSRSMDRVRSGLAQLRFCNAAEVGRLFIPCVSIRNNYDGAHPSLRLFNPEDTLLLHRYIRVALPKIRELVRHILESAEAMQSLPPYASEQEGEPVGDRTFELLRSWYPE